MPPRSARPVRRSWPRSSAGSGRGASAGQLRRLDSQIAAELLFALVEAALIECFTHGQGEREEAYLREAVACVEGAVRPRASSARSTPNEEILP